MSRVKTTLRALAKAAALVLAPGLAQELRRARHRADVALDCLSDARIDAHGAGQTSALASVATMFGPGRVKPELAAIDQAIGTMQEQLQRVQLILDGDHQAADAVGAAELAQRLISDLLRNRDQLQDELRAAAQEAQQLRADNQRLLEQLAEGPGPVTGRM